MDLGSHCFWPRLSHSPKDMASPQVLPHSHEFPSDFFLSLLVVFSVAENMHLTSVLGLLRAICTKKPHPYFTVLSFLRKKDNASCPRLHHLILGKLKI